MTVPADDRTRIFSHPSFDGHEQIVFCHDRSSRLRAIIAIHDTTLGPALGGCRMWPYASDGEALTDVLRLSRGMTYKNALADLPLGGGKSVILGDLRHDKSDALFAAFGVHIERLGGRYITAEDVGIGAEDVEAIGVSTRHVRGTECTGLGDPSPFTARGVFAGLSAAASHHFGSADLSGRTVAVQGIGSVGYGLCRFLHEAGARLIVADLAQAALDRARTEFGAETADPKTIHAADADIFAPCALGGILNERTIPEIRAKVIAGAANNQLATDGDGVALKERGITYAPDYVINAGGVISIALAEPGMTDDWMMARVGRIGAKVTRILERADGEGVSPGAIADRMAEEQLAEGPDPS